MKKIFIFLTTVVSIFLLAACSSNKDTRQLLEEPIKKDATTMGTYIQVTVYDPGKEKAVENSLKIAEKFNEWVSVDKADSVVDEINDNAGVKPVKVNSEIYQLIKLGYNYSSKGMGYDITIGPLSKLWNIGFPDARKPEQAEIDKVLPLINYQFIKFDDQNSTIYLSKKGARLDLGSIAKGYTAMKMVEELKENGVTTGIVDLGSSSIYVIGQSPRNDGDPWTIGIKDPNDPEKSQLGILQASEQHVNTSGIYERYLELDGHRYSHILNPKTGFPFDNDIASITLLISGDDASNGDGLSTMIYALGTKKGYGYVQTLKNVQAVFVDKDDKVYITDGLKDKFELTNKHYKLGKIADLK